MEIKKKKKKKWLIAGAVLAAGALVFFIGGRLRGQDGPPVLATTELVPGVIEKDITLRAPLEGIDKAEVVSSLHCEVVELRAAEGDAVTKGQLLAVLDDKDLLLAAEKARDQLELTRFQYQEALRESRQQYAKVTESLAAAELQQQRSQALYEAGSLSLKDLETDEAALKDLRNQAAAFSTSGGSVVLAASQNKQLSILEKALAEAEDKLSQARVTSPIDGTVTRVNIRLGRFADETEGEAPMFVVEDLSRLHMQVQISEYDIGQIALGQKVTVSAEILGSATVEGEVSRISPTGESKSGGTERIIPTVIDIKEADSKLIAGINAKAVIHLAKSEAAFVVPLEALMEPEPAPGAAAGADLGKEGWRVYRLSPDGLLETVTVNLGVENDLQAEIISDRLAAGDRIVSLVTPDLYEGMPAAAEAEAGDE